VSAWLSPAPLARRTVRTPFSLRQLTGAGGWRGAIWLLCLICLLALEGVALTHSSMWAAPALCVLFVVIVPYIPLVGFLALTLLARVLTDNSAAAGSRYSASVNLSGAIAALLILVAVGLLMRERRGLRVVVPATAFLLLTTAIAVRTNGASGETIREGVRELSILALAAVVFNSRGVLSLKRVTRMVQLVGVAPAMLALYQLATHTGADVEGQIRSDGTFAHPNGAAMFFAILAAVSVWRYIESGRGRSDALLAGLFAAATIATYSLTGLGALLAMLMVIGTLRPGSVRLKLGGYFAAAVVIGAFLATPLGAERIANESSTRLSSAQTRGTANTSFAWRLYKWGTLIPQWERSPIVGRGLGATVTAEGNSEDVTAGKVPHNEYLRYLVETGVLGLGILIAALVALIRALAARRRLSGVPDAGMLGIALVVGAMVNAAADNTILYSNTGYLLALLLGAILTISPGVRRTAPTVGIG